MEKLPPLGTVLALLLAAPRKQPDSSISPSGGARKGSSRKALEFLLRHLKNLVSKDASIEHVCVPLLEQIVRFKSPTSRKNALSLLHWIFKSEENGISLAKTLGQVLDSPQWDHGIKLAACIVARELLVSTEMVSLYSRMFASSLDKLVELVVHGSVEYAGNKSPTQLSVAAADCALVVINLLATEELDVTGSRIPSSVILWDHLRNLAILISELYEWNLSTRRLHAKGLLQIHRLLQDLLHDEIPQSSRVVVLHLCLKDYAKVMTLEPDGLFPYFKTYLADLMHFFQHRMTGEISWKMQCHILACLALIIGQMDSTTQNMAIENFREELLLFLLAQLTSNEPDAVDVTMELLKLIFTRQSESQMQALIPRLVELLSERRVITVGAGRFIAEHVLLHSSSHVPKVFDLLDSKDPICRQNAIETVVHLLGIVSASDVSPVRNVIGTQLLKRLEDQEFINRLSFSVFGKLDAEFVVAQLIQIVSNSDGRIRFTASKALVSALQYNPDQQKTVCLFLDHLQNSTTSKKGLSRRTADLDVFMPIVSSWACEVHEWQPLIIFLLDKMFAEPSNAIMPRFMSEISNHLADMYRVVFPRILEAMEKSNVLMGGEEQDHTLFARLSPLLVLKVLPLRAYDYLDCQALYHNGEHPAGISQLLIKWMCEPHEHDAVRKLAAELAARLIPQIMLPLVLDRLKTFIANRDILQTKASKACIYAICNSVMVRGFCEMASQLQPLLTEILLWPTTSDEIHNLQHGCIDCFAVLIFAESIRKQDSEEGSVLDKVLACLTNGNTSVLSNFSNDTRLPVSFRICMANVLISATSKVPSSCHGLLSDKMFPVIIDHLQGEKESLVRVALIQVLSSAVHNLKDANVVPFANNLLAISLSALQSRQGLPEEMFCGAKLLASILANQSSLSVIGSSLKQIRQALSNTNCFTPELRRICGQLLSCISSDE